MKSYLLKHIQGVQKHTNHTYIPTGSGFAPPKINTGALPILSVVGTQSDSRVSYYTYVCSPYHVLRASGALEGPTLKF